MAIKKTKAIFISLIFLLALVWAVVWLMPDNQLHLVFCDVGQGDAILIIHRSNQVLIDGGPNNDVLECLSHHLPFWDRQIEMVVLTHPDADHLTGLIDVIKRYDVNQFVVNSVVKDTAGFWAFRETVLAEQAKIHSPQAGEQISLGSLQFKVLWPEKGSSERSNVRTSGQTTVWSSQFNQTEVLETTSSIEKVNEESIVMLLSYGNFDAFLSGDIGIVTEKKLLSTPRGVDGVEIEVLKVPHHGSKYSSSEEFLKAVDPDLAVIMVGKNRFGHPTQEVIDRINSVNSKLLRTDRDGGIEIVSDGKSWYYR